MFIPTSSVLTHRVSCLHPQPRPYLLWHTLPHHESTLNCHAITFPPSEVTRTDDLNPPESTTSASVNVSKHQTRWWIVPLRVLCAMWDITFSILRVWRCRYVESQSCRSVNVMQSRGCGEMLNGWVAMVCQLVFCTTILVIILQHTTKYSNRSRRHMYGLFLKCFISYIAIK